MAEVPLDDLPDHLIPSGEVPESDLHPEQLAAVKKDRGVGEELLRQAGLTARDVIEGGANMVAPFSDPVAYFMNKAGLDVGTASSLGHQVSDYIGLPSPETPVERSVNETAKLLVGTGGIIGAAGKFGKLSQASTPIANSLAAAPGYQAASAVGSGAAGNYAKEKNLPWWAQFGAAFGGGLVPFAPGMGAVGNALTATGTEAKTAAQDAIHAFLSAKKASPAVDEAIQAAGLDLSTMPMHVKNSIRRDVDAALKTGNTLDPEALRRLAEYKMVGATPTVGTLNRDPGDFTRDKNLAKIGANSSDPEGKRLALIENENNKAFVGGVNKLGAEQAGDTIDDAATVIRNLKLKDEAAKQRISALYAQARDTGGRSIELDRSQFNNLAIDNLIKANKMDFLPDSIKSMMNTIAKGQIEVGGKVYPVPFTADTIDTLKTNLSNAMMSANGNEKQAIALVREALENTQPVAGASGEAMKAWDAARAANREYMQIVEKTPALAAVRDGIEPDQFMERFIFRKGGDANISDVAALKDSLKGNPEALKTIRNQILLYLKKAAVGESADDVAAFSQANYNKALARVGKQKLAMFLAPEDVEMLRAIGRVAAYDKKQPVGSAVNNSNSAAAAFAAFMDHFVSLPYIRRIPLLAEATAQPLKRAAERMETRTALNPATAIAPQRGKPQQLPQAPLGLMLYGSSSN